VGEDSCLLALAVDKAHLAFVLQEERTLVGASTEGAPAMQAPAVEWLAPRQGFMRRSASG
jgi:hypothetical protein